MIVNAPTMPPIMNSVGGVMSIPVDFDAKIRFYFLLRAKLGEIKRELCIVCFENNDYICV